MHGIRGMCNHVLEVNITQDMSSQLLSVDIPCPDLDLSLAFSLSAQSIENANIHFLITCLCQTRSD